MLSLRVYMWKEWLKWWLKEVARVSLSWTLGFSSCFPGIFSELGFESFLKDFHRIDVCYACTFGPQCSLKSHILHRTSTPCPMAMPLASSAVSLSPGFAVLSNTSINLTISFLQYVRFDIFLTIFKLWTANNWKPCDLSPVHAEVRTRWAIVLHCINFETEDSLHYLDSQVLRCCSAATMLLVDRALRQMESQSPFSDLSRILSHRHRSWKVKWSFSPATPLDIIYRIDSQLFLIALLVPGSFSPNGVLSWIAG